MVMAAAATLVSDGAKDPRLHSMGQSFKGLFSSGKCTMSAFWTTVVSLRYLPILLGSMWIRSKVQITKLSKQLGLRHPAMEKLFELALTSLALSSYLGLSGLLILVMCLVFSALAAALSVFLGFVGGSLFVFSSFVFMMGASLLGPVIMLSGMAVLSIAVSALFSSPESSGATQPIRHAHIREIPDEKAVEGVQDERRSTVMHAAVPGRIKEHSQTSRATVKDPSPISNPDNARKDSLEKDEAVEAFDCFRSALGERKARHADLDVTSLSPESQAALLQGKAILS